MVTVPGETWMPARRLGPPSVPAWLTLTDATSKAGASPGAPADWPNATAAAKRIGERGTRGIGQPCASQRRRLVWAITNNTANPEIRPTDAPRPRYSGWKGPTRTVIATLMIDRK